jgi:cytochrome P450
MLSLDGEEHDRHRAPFAAPFRPAAVRERFARQVGEETEHLLDTIEPAGRAELRRSFAGPLAAAVITRAIGLDPSESAEVLDWYDAIVAAVSAITAGEQMPSASRNAFDALRMRLLDGPATAHSPLSEDEFVSNAAVLLFGGIETTEGMIANAILHLLQRRDQLARVQRDPALVARAIEESLRLEPAAAAIDRYATRDLKLGDSAIVRGALVRVSIAAANRDPAVFADPDRFDLDRTNARRHLAFAHGPHVCLGIHLARLEARTAIQTLLARLPELRLDPERPSPVRGIVFRKPPALNVVWR